MMPCRQYFSHVTADIVRKFHAGEKAFVQGRWQFQEKKFSTKMSVVLRIPLKKLTLIKYLYIEHSFDRTLVSEKLMKLCSFNKLYQKQTFYKMSVSDSFCCSGPEVIKLFSYS